MEGLGCEPAGLDGKGLGDSQDSCPVEVTSGSLYSLAEHLKSFDQEVARQFCHEASSQATVVCRPRSRLVRWLKNSSLLVQGAGSGIGQPES